MASAQPRRRRRLMGEINVVPYIDVMLVLLIIFMITAPLLAEGIKVELPKAGARPIPPEMLKDSKPIVLTIDEAGRLFLNYGAKQDQPLDAAAVEAAAGCGASPCSRNRRAGARGLPRGLWRSSRGNDHPAARRCKQSRLHHAAAGTEASPLKECRRPLARNRSKANGERSRSPSCCIPRSSRLRSMAGSRGNIVRRRWRRWPSKRRWSTSAR